MRNKENDSTQTRHINNSNAVMIYDRYRKDVRQKAREVFVRPPYMVREYGK